MKDKIQILDQVLDGLMGRYTERVPDVSGIISAMVEEGIIHHPSDIENDHIAFRTLGLPHLGIASFEKIFLYYGYEKRDFYRFNEKKLNAYWYSPPKNQNGEFMNHPRIFISELRVQDLSDTAQNIIRKYTGQVQADPVDALDLDDALEVDAFLHMPLWSTPSLSDYERLLEESEYAAWVIYNRYYLNHFTISVHNLPGRYSNIENFNAFLEQKGFRLNTAGGKIKTSPDGGLRQSSTVAGMVEAVFAGAEKKRISGSYVEFAERSILPEFRHLPKDQIERKHRREGFEAGNADKIFESTYSTQTGK
ncbi:MAG: DUF1338 domain-containing protein [Cyclobacteriaceae bacterium]|nr:DUF1338 domain-containing protein [Cyclobacteriaceae bacterium]